jgi:hypothetical protein
LLEALEFIRDHNPVEVRLSQETAFYEDRADEVRLIQSVSVGRTSSGEQVFVCEQTAGSFYIGAHGEEHEGPVELGQIIWPRTGTIAVAALANIYQK